jgi:hypothetical protein
MGLDEMHPFSEGELATVKPGRGVFVLFQIQIPIHVDAAEDLQKGLREARTKFPRASHFAVEAAPDEPSMRVRLQELQRQMTRVRAATFFEKTEG